MAGIRRKRCETSLPETVLPDRAKSVITTNNSPDVGFEQSINPYRGCSHGCVYCFARPTHAYLGLSPGLDFETKLFYKDNAVELLRAELSKRNYVCKTIALGINTDGWQPLERRLEVTRSVLEVLAECRHPVTIVTKSALDRARPGPFAGSGSRPAWSRSWSVSPRWTMTLNARWNREPHRRRRDSR